VSGTVYDGWAEWRLRIETKINWRGSRVWRWRLDRKFVTWDFGIQRGFWTTSEQKARDRGARRLAAKYPHRYEEAGGAK